MKLITTITNDPKQEFQVYTEDGSTLYIKLYYYITQKSWFFDFTFGNYVCKGSRVVLTPNALRHLRKILPFGIAFLTDSKVEPYSLDDFSSGRVKMGILDKEEIEEIESSIYYDN